MASRWTSLTLALAVSWAPGAARAEEKGETEAKAKAPDGVLPGQDLEHPPRGTPEDQALWRSGFEVTQAVHLERARATRLQTVLLNLRYDDRLKTLEGRGGDAAKRAAALQRGLSDAHAVQFSVLTARWPVDTYRVCSYPAMEFGSMSAGNPTPDEVAKHRAMLTGCVEQAQASVKLLKQGNDGLEGAMKAAEEALGQAGLGPPTGPGAAPARAAPPSPAKGSGPAPAAAEKTSQR
jgi:hypothetical protein